MSLPQLVQASKSLPYAPDWTEPDEEDGFTRFVVPLEIGGIVESGLLLSGGAYAHHPDRHVWFELCVDVVRRIRLMRLEWRSLTGGHSNQRKSNCAPPWDGVRVPATHLHDFDLNYVPAKGVMKRGNLPCARSLEQEPQSFEDLRAFVGTHFRINNIGIVPPPPWVYGLF